MAVWKQSRGWKYETFERDVDPDLLPGFEDLVRLWQARRGDRPAPAWSDFEFRDFAGWHGRIAMLEVFHDPFDMRYLLFGETVAERYRADFTGRLLSDLVESGQEPAEDMPFYEMATARMLIARVSGELNWLQRPHVSSIFVEFPLSDNGETTTHLLAAMI